MHPRSIAERILAYIQMIATHLYQAAPINRRETSSVVRKWSPPPDGTVLINVDATIFSSTRQIGMGAVIRDHNGMCLAACRERAEEVVAPKVAEALAILRAIFFAKDEGFSKIIVSSVVNRVTSGHNDRSFCGPVIYDIRSLASSFASCSFVHVYRHLNVAAHRLAKLSESTVCSVWRGFASECIREIICNDLFDYVINKAHIFLKKKYQCYPTVYQC
jgi:hypothetical protein